MPASRTTWRHASTTSVPDASSASTSSSRSGRSSPRAIRRAAGASISQGGAFDLRRQRWDVRLRARRARPERARRAPPSSAGAESRSGNHQLVGGPRRGRKGRGIERGERALGLVEAPDQEQAPDLEIARMRGVDPVAVRFERRPRRVERLRRPAQVARDERDLGLGNDAPRARHRLFRTEGARCTAAAEPWLERDRRAAPSRCRAARAPAASSRSATRFNAPSGSPAASARAAAVISESIGIPSHLYSHRFDRGVKFISWTSNSECAAKARHDGYGPFAAGRMAASSAASGGRPLALRMASLPPFDAWRQTIS